MGEDFGPTAPAGSTGLIATARPRTAWESRKAILICVFMAMAFWQFNMDTIFSNSFQAMPSFLLVFGFPQAVRFLPAVPVIMN